MPVRRNVGDMVWIALGDETRHTDEQPGVDVAAISLKE